MSPRPTEFNQHAKAKRVAVLVPGTQSPGDCVTDLKALPVRVVADGRRAVRLFAPSRLDGTCSADGA